tara:strand:+ start:890 stop:1126 length:237 start_codon:yes stop_codon:yes gene_type:complete
MAAKEEYEDIHFFAFNVDNDPSIEKKLKFNGVPTISLIKTNTGNTTPKVRILKDPDQPNEKTWYRISDIRKFIMENRK